MVATSAYEVATSAYEVAKMTSAATVKKCTLSRADTGGCIEHHQLNRAPVVKPHADPDKLSAHDTHSATAPPLCMRHFYTVLEQQTCCKLHCGCLRVIRRARPAAPVHVREDTNVHT
jgi:hypothetical protein